MGLRMTRLVPALLELDVTGVGLAGFALIVFLLWSGGVSENLLDDLVNVVEEDRIPVLCEMDTIRNKHFANKQSKVWVPNNVHTETLEHFPHSPVGQLAVLVDAGGRPIPPSLSLVEAGEDRLHLGKLLLQFPQVSIHLGHQLSGIYQSQVITSSVEQQDVWWTLGGEFLIKTEAGHCPNPCRLFQTIRLGHQDQSCLRISCVQQVQPDISGWLQ